MSVICMSKLIFVRAATFGQLTEHIFDHERLASKPRSNSSATSSNKLHLLIALFGLISVSVHEVIPPNLRNLWISLRHDREDPCRKTGTAFRFRETHDDNRAGLGNLIEIRKQLNLVMVCAQDISLE